MTTERRTPSMSEIKARQQKTWAAGDYGKPGVTLLIMAELLCESADLRPGSKALDVACGNGNTALAAARRNCETTAVDFVPALLEEGRTRARAEGFDIEFREGDAEDLPFPDSSFDAVLSTIGVMFAPNQEKAASELLRVCRPGGRIGIASWTPDGFVGNFFRTVAGYIPPPPGLKPPILWGTEDRLLELFGDGILALDTTRRSFVFRYPSARHWVEFMGTYFGPLVKAFESLDDSGRESLSGDLEDLVGKHNRAADGTAVWPGDYLEAVATKR